MSHGDLEHDLALEASSLEEVLDDLPIGAILVNSEGTILRFNRHEEQLSGLSRADVLGRSFFSEVAPCTQDIELGARFHEGIATGSLDLDFEFSFPYPHNRVPRDVRIRARSVRHSEQALHVVLIEDITSRRQLERNNAEMMAGLRALVRTSRGQAAQQDHLLYGDGAPVERQACVVRASLGKWRHTHIAEVAPAALFRTLDARLQAAIAVVHRRGGKIISVEGSGITACFFEDEAYPQRALADALRAAHHIARDGEGRELKLPFRVSLTQGSIVNGPIGHELLGERLLVGPSLELARDLVRHARAHELIIAGEALINAVRPLAELERLRLPEHESACGEVARVGTLHLPRV